MCSGKLQNKGTSKPTDMYHPLKRFCISNTPHTRQQQSNFFLLINSQARPAELCIGVVCVNVEA